MSFSKEQVSLLQQPISAEFSCGVYLKLDKSAFRSLRNEFNVAQTSLRKLFQNPTEEQKEALEALVISDWQALESSLLTLFTSTTRDIELIAWFIAAQILLDSSLEGGVNALHWLADLIENHWHALHPRLGENPPSTTEVLSAEEAHLKIKAFGQFVGDSEDSSLLYAPLLQVPLIGNVTFFDFQSAERKGEHSALKISLAPVLKEEKEDVQEKLNNLVASLEAIERLDGLLKIKCKESQAGFVNLSFVKNLFFKMNSALSQLSGMTGQSLIKENAEEKPQDTQEESLDLDASHSASEERILSSQDNTDNLNEVPMRLRADNLNEVALSNNMNRDLAFRMLRDVSDYFHVTEPHSPISFMLEKTIRWGYLSLPELFQEILKEKKEEEIGNIFSTLGLDEENKIDLPN